MLILDSEDVQPACRDDALETAFSSTELPQQVRYVLPAPSVRHRADLHELGPGVRLLRNVGTGVHIVRGTHEVRQGAPEQVAVCLQSSGIGYLDCDGLQYVKNPGDLSLQDTTRPYSYRQSERNDHRVVLMDPVLLALPVNLVRQAAHTLPASPLYPLVRRHFASLHLDLVDLPADASLRLGRATVQLVAALVSSAVGDARQHEALADSLQVRITMYIDEHLADAALGAEQIAAAHNVSVRQLYRIWSRCDHRVPLAEWILRRRLERAWDQLADARARQTTIAGVARDNGFTNASHFTRQFHRAFNLTPRDWRQLSHHSPGRPPVPPPVPPPLPPPGREPDTAGPGARGDQEGSLSGGGAQPPPWRQAESPARSNSRCGAVSALGLRRCRRGAQGEGAQVVEGLEEVCVQALRGVFDPVLGRVMEGGPPALSGQPGRPVGDTALPQRPSHGVG